MADQSAVRLLLGATLCATIVGVSLAIVHSPWVITGVVLGGAVLVIALLAPLALVALMLVIGPIDLSFTTGGFKSLLPQMGGLDMNGIRLLGATAGFVAFIMFEQRSLNAAFGPLGRGWLVFLGFAGATLAVSMDRLEGLRLLLKLAYPFLTFLIVIGLANSRERLYTLLKYTLGAAAIYTIVINPILAMNGGYRIDFDGTLRVGGLGSGDNPFAFYVTAILMMAFARFMIRREIPFFLLSLVLIVWVALTGTRIAALASVIGMTLIGLFTAFSSGNRKMIMATVFAVVIATVVLLPNVLQRSLGFVPTPGELYEIARSPLTLYNSVNWQGRELLWAILWGAFMSSPIFGLGLGSSTAVIVETFPDQGVRVAHNEYMRLLTDTGVLGLLFFAFAMGSWLIGAARMSRRGDSSVREFAYPAVAVVVSWILIALTDNAIDYYNNFSQYLGFLMGGAVVLFQEQQRERGVAA